MWVGLGTCSPILLGLMFFLLRCPQEQGCLLCPFPHLYVWRRSETFFSLWGLCFSLFWLKKSAMALSKLQSLTTLCCVWGSLSERERAFEAPQWQEFGFPLALGTALKQWIPVSLCLGMACTCEKYKEELEDVKYASQYFLRSLVIKWTETTALRQESVLSFAWWDTYHYFY